MMTGWFDDESRRAALVAELESWNGTPFRLRSSVKGSGCDCVATPARVYAHIGAVGAMTLPPYRIRTLSPAWLELLCSRLEAAGFAHLFDNPTHDPALFGRAEAAYLRAGDLLVFSNGKGLVHLGVFAGGNQFYHAKYKRRWGSSAFVGTPYQRSIYRIYRLKG